MAKKKQNKKLLPIERIKDFDIKNPALSTLVLVISAVLAWLFMILVALTCLAGAILIIASVVLGMQNQDFGTEMWLSVSVGVAMILVGWALSRLYTRDFWDIFQIPMP